MLDRDRVTASLQFDPQDVAALRASWLALLDVCVWGELKSTQLGALSRLRKRVLELGEHLRSLVADRSWIPHPREQVKSALAASLNLRDTLLSLERAAKQVEGGEQFQQFEDLVLGLRHRLLLVLEQHEGAWTELLEGQYDVEEGG
jgi:hypothetical protein